MDDFTIPGHLLPRLRQTDAQAQALCFGDERILAGQLLDDIEALGTALYARGFAGKRVAAVARSEYGYVLLALACLCGRITLVPLYEGWPEDERTHMQKRANAAACFERYDTIPGLVAQGRELLEQGSTEYLQNAPSASDVSMILFTSGTTGESKGVLFLQRSWMPYLEQTPQLGWNTQTLGTQLLVLPLFHIFGMAILLAFVSLGVPVVFGRGPEHLVTDLRKVQPKVLFLVPAQVDLLYRLLREDEASSAPSGAFAHLTQIVYGGEALSQGIVDGLREQGVCVHSTYSMTETGGITFDPYSLRPVKPGSSGRLYPAVRNKVRIDHPNAQGCGELLVSADYVGVFGGYLDEPQKTDNILNGGWVHTGDLVRIDEDGDLFVVGRIKNLIILSNGENVSPERLERKVMSLSGVRDCRVYEEDDSIAVAIVPEDPHEGGSQDEAARLMRERVFALNRTLPPYEQISRIHLSSKLERGASGKLVRQVAKGECSPADRSPLVSVIVPVYNACETLERCVLSILDQSLRDLELIVADDKSTDGSLEIAQQLAGQDERVRVLALPHGGVAAARNAALDAARGTYVMFADADDWLDSQAVEHAVRAAKRYDSDLVVWDFAFEHDGQRQRVCMPHDEGPVSARQYAQGLAASLNVTYLVIWNKLYRRELIEAHGLRFPQLPLWQDACFALDYACRASSVVVVRKQLYHYVDQKGSISYREPSREGGAVGRRSFLAVMSRLDAYLGTVFADDPGKGARIVQQAYDRVAEVLDDPRGMRTALLFSGQTTADLQNPVAQRPMADTMATLLADALAIAPGERVALRWWPNPSDDEPQTITYAELRRAVERLGAALAAAGCTNRRVAVVMDGSAWSVVTFASLLCRGISAVLIGVDESPQTMRGRLEQTDAELLVCDDARMAPDAKAPYVVWSLWKVERIAMGDQPVGKELAPCAMAPDNEAFLLFTSGTTGQSKCVVRTQRNMASTVEGNAATLYYGSEQLQVLPAHHEFGIENLLATLAQGLTVTLSRGMRHWADEIARYRVENIFAVPAQLAVLAELLTSGKMDHTGLRFAFSASAALPRATADALNAAGVQVVESYGSSEAGVIAAPVFEGGRYRDQAGSSGFLRPCVEWRLRGTGEDCVGELLVRGASVSPGHLGEGGKIVPLSDGDGWFATGDLARVDGEGRVFLCGRAKDLIILSSGENVAPAELEAAFGEVADVRECLALEHDGSICLLVVPDDDADPAALTRGLLAANAQLPSWKRVGAFYLSGPLPRTANGKLRRAGVVIDEGARIALRREGEQEGGPLGAVLDAFRDAFGGADVGQDDDFFALGGDSLSGMGVVAALREAGYQLALHDLFAHATPCDLATHLQKGTGATNLLEPVYANELKRLTAGETIAPGVPAHVVERIATMFAHTNVEAIYPAKGMDVDDLAQDKTNSHLRRGYFLDKLVVLREPMEEAKFYQRVASIAQRHPMLRSAWVADDERWYQVVLGDGQVPAHYEDRRNLPGGAAEKLRVVRKEYERRYAQRERESLPEALRVWCYRLDERSCALLVELTHLGVDGFSEELLLRELALGPNPAREDNYHLWRLWQLSLEQSEQPEAKAFWDRFAREVDVRGLVPYADDPPGTPMRWKMRSRSRLFPIRIGQGLSSAIRDLAKRERVTPAEVISFAYYRSYLALYGIDAVLFKEFLSGRENAPLNLNATYAYAVCSPPCWLSTTDTLRDYHQRLAEISRHAQGAYKPLWERHRHTCLLMNKMLFDKSWRSGVQSVVSLTDNRDFAYPGNDIVGSYLSQVGEQYRVDVFAATDDLTQRKLARLSELFVNELSQLTARG